MYLKRFKYPNFQDFYCQKSFHSKSLFRSILWIRIVIIYYLQVMFEKKSYFAFQKCASICKIILDNNSPYRVNVFQAFVIRVTYERVIVIFIIYFFYLFVLIYCLHLFIYLVTFFLLLPRQQKYCQDVVVSVYQLRRYLVLLELRKKLCKNYQSIFSVPFALVRYSNCLEV